MAIQTNILQYLENTAPRLPQKIAYSDGTDSITFAQLYRSARAVGCGLLSRGYAKEPIAILMEKHPRVPAAFFGTVYAGCFYVPLDSTMPLHRMEVILEQVGARAVVVDEKNRRTAESLCFKGEIISYDDLANHEIREEQLAAVRARQLDIDPIYIVFTSGSTGIPKGVSACHRSVIDYVEALSDALGFSEESVFANQTPLYFDAPLKEIMPTLKLGATTYFVPKMLFSFPVRLIEYLNEYRINTVCCKTDLDESISSESEIILGRSTHHCFRIKNHDTVMRLSDAEFVLCADHTEGFNSTDLRLLDLEILA